MPVRLVRIKCHNENALENIRRKDVNLRKKYGIYRFNFLDPANEGDPYIFEIEFPIFEKMEVTRQKVKNLSEEVKLQRPLIEIETKDAYDENFDYDRATQEILEHNYT